jgi:hypothetical protein
MGRTSRQQPCQSNCNARYFHCSIPTGQVLFMRWHDANLVPREKYGPIQFVVADWVGSTTGAVKFSDIHMSQRSADPPQPPMFAGRRTKPHRVNVVGSLRWISRW